MDFPSCQVWFSKIVKASIVIIWILHVCEAAISSLSGASCTPNEIYMEEARNGTCSRQYLRCESATWNRALCVGGFFNATMKECVPFNDQCKEYVDTDDKHIPVVRHKRQATTDQDCTGSYQCPRNIIQEYIYPDWANRECDTFYKCLKGVMTKHSCKTDVYKYYNPRTFSCEEQVSRTNTCLLRMFTNLDPL